MDFLQQSVQNRIIVLFIAAAVDLLIGDPHWLWHPVQGVGTLISFFEKILRRIFAVLRSSLALASRAGSRDPDQFL